MIDYPQRIKQLRVKYNLTQEQLAKKLGVGRTTIAYIEQGSREINDSVKLNLLKEFYYDIENDVYIKELENIDIKPKNLIKLPFYRIGVSAGSGTYINDDILEDYIIFDKRVLNVLLPKNSNLEYLQCFSVSGDSMTSPEGKGILNGDLIFVDISKKQIFDGIYVIEANNELRIKRLIKNLDGTLFIQSDNPKYPKEVFNPETSDFTLSIVGRVIFNISRSIF